MRTLKFGFSVKGLVVVLLVLIPNIIWAIHPPTYDILATASTPFSILDVFENIGRIGTMVFLIIIVSKSGLSPKYTKIFLLLCICLIAAYYVMWVLYYQGNVSPAILICMAAFPSAYFILAGIGLKNYIAMITAMLFAATHIIITYSNYA